MKRMIKQSLTARYLTFLLLGWLILASGSAGAQNISKVEYFFDSDPGFGLGTDVPVTPSPDISNFTFQINLTSVSTGFHDLFVRVMDDSLRWSLTENKTFYKGFVTIQPGLADLTALEYFLDADPGFGAGTAVALPAGTHVTNFTFMIDLTSVTPGFHTLYIRVKDADGRWSMCDRGVIYKGTVTGQPGLPDVVAAEYFIDSDPGFGMGTAIPLTPSANISNHNFLIDLSSVSPGFHDFFVRVKDSFGRWSMAESKTFFKGSVTNVPVPDIVKAEYFFNADPGFGQGTEIPVTPSQDVTNLNFMIDISQFPLGTYTLWVRAMDSNGRWSMVEHRTFTMDYSPVSVTITASANPSCSGTPVTFTAVPVNGGTNPTYQWKKNGQNVGGNSPTYTYTPVNNDNIVCVLTSSLTNVNNNPATSNTITMTVNPVTPVSVSVAASANPVCPGTQVTFTATPVNGGTPSYQWYKNDQPMGSNSSTYAVIPANGDQVKVVMTSNFSGCLSGNPATSNIITVSHIPHGSISIVASANPICSGDPEVTFTATPLNPGANPAYQWKVNGTNAGSGGLTFSYNPASNDKVTCVMTSDEPCTQGASRTSNEITMSVNPSLPVSISIVSTATQVCQGAQVSFTATPVNGGTTPSYQWKVNDMNAGTNSPAFAYIPANNDVVTCILTSGYTCPTGNPAASNPVTITVYPVPAAPSGGGSQTVCSNTLPVALTATVPQGITVDWYNAPAGGTLLLSGNPVYVTSTAGTWYAESRDPLSGCKNASRTAFSLTVQSTVQYWKDQDGDGYGNPEIPVSECSQPSGYVTNAQDCNDNDPNINPASQYLSFTGAQGHTNSIVSPLQGTPFTFFHFEVDYFNATNALPPSGYPRLILDYEGNGSYTDANDRVVIMTAYDPADGNTADGKRYFTNINSLPYGSSWTSKIIVGAGGVCQTSFGPFIYPDVLHAPNLYIFANDISITPNHPDPSEPVTISAVIHNESDFNAQNFVVHLINQWDYNISYPDITVPFLAAHQNTTVTWNITSPADSAWCPMQVIADHTNVIAENNELDNSAVRPFVNGNFPVAGDIVVQSVISPSTYYSGQYQYLALSGRSWYTDLAVQLPDSSVAGATVEFEVDEFPGTTYTGYTNNAGYFSVYFSAPVPPGTYHISGSVTDFTLTGDFTGQFIVLPPVIPETRPNLALSNCQTPEISPVNPHLSDSLTLKATILNNGNAVAYGPIEVQFSYSTGGTFSGQYNGNLSPGQNVPVSVRVPRPSGTGTEVSVNVDPNNLVNEWNETTADNSRTDNMCYDFQPVGICGSNFWGTTYCMPNSRMLTINPYTGLNSYDLYIANPVAILFEMSGPGISGWQTIGTSILSNAAKTCSCPYVVYAPNSVVLTETGVFTFRITVDPGDAYPECNESNNVLTVNLTVVDCPPPPPPVLKPDLYIASCSGMDVKPVDPVYPGTATIEAKIINGGNGVANGPVDVEFVYSTGGTFTTQYAGNINPGQTVTLSVQAPLPPSPPGAATLTVTADPLNTIEEWSEDNNAASGIMCHEFQPVAHCGYNFWQRTYTVGQSAILSVGLNVQHLYDASTGKVKFEVSGPGISGTLDLGTFTLNNVYWNCSCPWVVLNPVPFTFFDPGVYHFTMTADPEDDYMECNENNNVLEVDVTVIQTVPDMRILSQFINPNPLNPQVNEDVSLIVTYENTGSSNVNDQMKMKIIADNTTLSEIYPVPGLPGGDHYSVAIPQTWSSNLPGAHVIRAVIDSDGQISESSETNNEATRAIIVGEAANLYFRLFTSSDENPDVGDPVMITARIGNEGEMDATGNLKIYYVDDSNDTIPIGQSPVSVAGDDSVSVIMPWTVADNQTTLIGRIVDVNTLEFNSGDNETSDEIGGGLEVNLVSIPGCFGGENGRLTANVAGGAQPYLIVWSNGEIGPEIIAGAGEYSATVTDNAGVTKVVTGMISETSSIYPAVAGDAEVCLDTVSHFYTTDPGMFGYVWNISSGGIITGGGGSGDDFVRVRWTDPGIKSVTVNYSDLNGCTAIIPGQVHTEVLQKPLPIITGPESICSGEPDVFYATETGMTGYLWTISTGGTITDGQGTNSITVLWNTIGQQWVEVGYQGVECSSVLTRYDVTVSPGTVPGNVSGGGILSYGMEAQLNLDGSTGSILRWQKRLDGGNWTDIASASATFSEIPDTTGTWDYRAEVRSGTCSAMFSGMATVVVEPVIRTVNLKLFLEGLYNPATQQMNKAQDENGDKYPGTVADRIQVLIAEPGSPYSLKYSVNEVDLDQDGTCTVSVPRAGYYYVLVRHRNSIETWSGIPVNAMSEPASFDFTTAASQAFGDNQREISGVYAVWGGDVNQDGIVDASDMNPVDNASTAITFGYIPEDVNGDGIVDGGDMNIVDNNSTAIIFAVTP